MDPDDLISALLMRQRRERGSPADIVEERWKPMMEALYSGDASTIDATEGNPGDDSGAEIFGMLAQHSRPEGINAFLASGPHSERIDDRRGEDVMDAIKRYMISMSSADEPVPDDTVIPSSELPIPSFDYGKRSR